ncbi:S-adenosyl-L-methionine-dependent methyltransferase [Ceraceosorus guamensis]|uniref:S-adenosyl-L-methionine-dependent methyltransferase n=1 Tax=Ceraceosorus guamensis TaxID=1522189 RepID=A0A316VSD8_9BASI|nr:S-adenosyl-L-methionine-dependent methyltransferase [Ceraceosorus guamensis]PWN40549.1 S-adenosyl-L-methionine-dependent methyltransferase [Ceraceosorus guamensis]
MSALNTPSASDWSSHSVNYDTRSHPDSSRPNATSEAPTQGMIRRAFIDHFLPLIDQLLSYNLDTNEARVAPFKLHDSMCGTGAELTALLEHYAEGKGRTLARNGKLQIVATDFAQGMVDSAKAKVKHFDQVEQMVDFGIVDVMNVPYPDNHFDVDTMIMGPGLVPDPDKAMAESVRVLKAGGLALYAQPYDIQGWDFFNEPLQTLGFLSKGSPKMQDLPMLAAFRDVEAVKGRLERAGLHKDSIQHAFSEDYYTCSDIVKFTSDLFANPGMRAAFLPLLNEDQRSQVRDEAIRMVHEKYPDGVARLKHVVAVWWGYKPT